MELSARYERTGVLAIEPTALSQPFSVATTPTTDFGGVPVVTITGPLEHHAGSQWDHYDAILGRVSAAMDAPAPGVVLRMDSPGGLVSGVMETARAIRALADARGKRLIGFVDGQASSAAYALVCGAHSIVIPDTGNVGSIGVIASRLDISAVNEAAGVRVAVVTSGIRKTDGCPEVALTPDALAALQDTVDTLASVLFEHVAAHRPTTAEAVRALQGGSFIGARAVNLGLADAVGSLSDALALARGEMQSTAAEPQEESPMTLAEAVEALKAAAESDDTEESAKAKRMLAAMEPEDDGEEEDKAEEPAPEPEPKKEDEDTSAKAVASQALATAQSALRATILATRPDLSAEAKSKLANVPVSALADVLSAIPRAAAAITPPKAAAPVLGEGQGGVTGKGIVPASPDEDLDSRMGFSAKASPIKTDGLTKTYGVFATREQAREIHAKHTAGGAR